MRRRGALIKAAVGFAKQTAGLRLLLIGAPLLADRPLAIHELLDIVLVAVDHEFDLAVHVLAFPAVQRKEFMTCRSEPSSIIGRSGGLFVAILPLAVTHSIAEVVGHRMAGVGRQCGGGRRRRGGDAHG